MGHGSRGRGPVGRISGLSRVESADIISRVRATERVSGATAIGRRVSPERSFAAALERQERGLVSSEPLPSPEPLRPLPLPARGEDRPELPERLPDSFMGILWWKMKTRL
jgi:hypothetical protein